ncbi:MBL fold metallo-hydrolase [Spongisporangium articulatum]|uniref:MBL fold metallo-hydrolase n=1 Tax=Spongisporangium articulatum TaxID=3362603 RepID=A0ABW8AKN4_9ACTN
MTGYVSLHGAPGEYPRGYTELARGTWAWLEPNGSWGEANAGLVVGDGETLVVDTLWDVRLAAEMLGEAESLVARAPITTAVNTHRDGDHWWGNVALPPDVRIWASDATRAEIDHEPPPRALATLNRLSRLSRHAPGRVGRLASYTADMLGPFAHGRTTPRPPTDGFAREHTLDVGGREVRLLRLGPAHTDGDAVVHVPDAGVVFAGDLLFVGVTPVIWVGPMSHWVTAIDRLLALGAEHYVPGHGPLATRDDLLAQRAYWEWLISASTLQFETGRPPAEVMRRLVDDPGFGRFRDWLAPERLALNVLARHRELTGAGPAQHDPVSRSVMFSHVAELHRVLS